MTPPHPTSPEEIFARLRAQLFGGHLAPTTALAADAVPPERSAASPRGASTGGGGPSQGPELDEAGPIGVVIEIGTQARTLLVFGLCDGTASLHWSTGGGMIGGQDRPRLNAAAKRLVEAAGPLVAELPLVTQHPLPAPGRVRVSILTSAGVHAGEDDETSLMKGQGPLFPLFLAGNDIVKGFRVEQPPPPSARHPSDESLYVTCLLTALARSHAASAVVTEGTRPPDPATLSTDPRDLEWFAAAGLPLASLSTSAIISTLLGAAGLRQATLDQAPGRIRVRLATYGQPPSSLFDFRVTGRRREGRTEVEVALMRD